MLCINSEVIERRGGGSQVFLCPGGCFLKRVGRLGSDWDATVTGGTSIVRGKKKQNIRAKGPFSLQPGCVCVCVLCVRACSERLHTLLRCIG